MDYVVNTSIVNEGKSPLIVKGSGENPSIGSCMPAEAGPHMLSKAIPSIISYSPPSADIRRNISE